jgi:hypothetical protein
MKDNSVLAQFTSRVTPVVPKVEAEPEQEADGEEDFGAYGLLRGVRDRAVMLELRRRDGSIIAFNYTWLERVEFDVSGDISLKFGGHSVRITGRHLNAELRPNVRLLDALCRHRVPWIQEADAPSLRRADRAATMIERIEIE